jgi:hypothetical protein
MAIAAHLHVLMRRKTGRVTDTEWMAGNAEYATEIIRLARASAAQDGHADLAELADKLEAAVLKAHTHGAPARPNAAAVASAAAVGAGPDGEAGGLVGTALRYVRGIR